MLRDQVHPVWSASARVVEIWLRNNPAQNPTVNSRVQARNQAASRQVDPLVTPCVIAKEVPACSPSKIKKTEQLESAAWSEPAAGAWR